METATAAAVAVAILPYLISLLLLHCATMRSRELRANCLTMHRSSSRRSIAAILSWKQTWLAQGLQLTVASRWHSHSPPRSINGIDSPCWSHWICARLRRPLLSLPLVLRRRTSHHPQHPRSEQQRQQQQQQEELQ